MNNSTRSKNRISDLWIRNDPEKDDEPPTPDDVTSRPVERQNDGRRKRDPNVVDYNGNKQEAKKQKKKDPPPAAQAAVAVSATRSSGGEVLITKADKDEMDALVYRDLPKDEGTAAKALKTLADFCDPDGDAPKARSEYIMKSSFIAIVIWVMKYKESPEVLKQGFRIMSDSTYFSNKDKSGLLPTGIFEFAVDQIEQCPKNVVVNILWFLNNCLVDLRPMIKKQLAEKLVLKDKAVLHLAAASHKNPTSCGVHCAAINFMEQLKDLEDLRRPIVKDGGTSILGTALSLFDPKDDKYTNAKALMETLMES